MLITPFLQLDSKTTGKLETKSGILIFTIILGAGESRHTNMMKTYLLSFSSKTRTYKHTLKGPHREMRKCIIEFHSNILCEIKI